jgi:glutamyl/glutaminyl-tRNA synthetase
VRDVVDLTWETLRMRRFKAQLLASATSKGLERILQRAGNNWTEDRDLSRRWAVRDRQAIKQVDKRLATMGLTIEAVTAETFVVMIDNIERVDRMIMNAEARRNAALREVDRHRSSVAQSLRRASEEAVEAEFEDVTPDQIGRKDVA